MLETLQVKCEAHGELKKLFALTVMLLFVETAP